MWHIIVCKDNIVEECYTIEERDLAIQAFFDECKVIDDEFVLLDQQTILEDGFHTCGMYGVSLWTVFAP